MITEREHREIQVVGYLNAALELLSRCPQPQTKELNEKLMKATDMVRQLSLAQWSATDKLVEEKW